MRRLIVAVMVIGALFIPAAGAWADSTKVAQAPAVGDKAGAAEQAMPGKGAVGAVRVRGTVAAIDKEQGTVTLKGPKRTVMLEVRDRQKLDVIKVGDPVVALYVEALVIQLRKAGTVAPSVTARETRVSSQPGETPGGAVGREISLTAAITAIDRKAHTVTIKGPEGRTETVTMKDPRNLDVAKVGDLVDITYTQALAVSLDKPAK
jgi:Cu/Ag efflux protein CusF